MPSLRRPAATFVATLLSMLTCATASAQLFKSDPKDLVAKEIEKLVTSWNVECSTGLPVGTFAILKHLWPGSTWQHKRYIRLEDYRKWEKLRDMGYLLISFKPVSAAFGADGDYGRIGDATFELGPKAMAPSGKPCEGKSDLAPVPCSS